MYGFFYALSELVRHASALTAKNAESKIHKRCRAINSAGECYLHTVEVTGSIPVPPTNQQQGVMAETITPLFFNHYWRYVRIIFTAERERTAVPGLPSPIADPAFAPPA